MSKISVSIIGCGKIAFENELDNYRKKPSSHIGAILKYKNIKDSQESVTDWINGALTGLDFAKGVLGSKSNIPSADSRYFWVINYCEQNPLSNISDAAIELYLEIIK